MSSGKRFLRVVILVLLAAGAGAGYYSWKTRSLHAGYETAIRLCDEKRYAEAIPMLLSVHRWKPSSREGIDALHRYCLCCEAAGRTEDARGGWKKILSNPDAARFYPDATIAIARLEIAAGHLDEAAGRLDAFLKTYPASPLLGDLWFLRSEILRKKGDLPGAFHAAQRVLDDYPGSASVSQAQERLGDLYISLLFSPQIIPGTEEYVVRQGDSLEAIAKRTGTTVELLREMNKEHVRGDVLRRNDRLKICTTKFSIVVDKSANTLTLKADERAAKRYPVGTGKQGSTPVGEFKITNRIAEPEWYKPGGGVIPYGSPENLLGTRWMGIDYPGYGIHGTWEPETIGKQASAGCIRMHNKDVEELYKIVPVGTHVRIIE